VSSGLDSDHRYDAMKRNMMAMLVGTMGERHERRNDVEVGLETVAQALKRSNVHR